MSRHGGGCGINPHPTPDNRPLALSRQSYRQYTRQVHNNLAAQLELLGEPYSSGDAPGEGVRLLLGSDALGIGSKVTTRWLLPASAAAFDARCAGRDLGAAVDAGCPMMGALWGREGTRRRGRTAWCFPVAGLRHGRVARRRAHPRALVTSVAII